MLSFDIWNIYIYSESKDKCYNLELVQAALALPPPPPAEEISQTTPHRPERPFPVWTLILTLHMFMIILSRSTFDEGFHQIKYWWLWSGAKHLRSDWQCGWGGTATTSSRAGKYLICCCANKYAFFLLRVLLLIYFWVSRKMSGSESCWLVVIFLIPVFGSYICLKNISLHLFIICVFSSFWQTWEKDFPWQRRRIFNVTKLLFQSKKWTYSKPCKNWKVEDLWRKCEK